MNALDKNRFRPLHAALDKDYIDVVLLVLEHGVDVNAKNNNGSTALHLALGGSRPRVRTPVN